MVIKPANGQTGYLIWCGGDRYVFRVYDQEHNFVDYDIKHSDMRIQIQDEDAHFYAEGEDNWVDHSPETLGIKV
jgi:hypothetical protein